MGKKYNKIVGTGGIGKGIFFLSHDNAEFGRNESRMARLSDAKDFCKLHIVFHYLRELLPEDVSVIPICKIGRDEYGAELKKLIENTGMSTKWIREITTNPTMLSICLQYPDKCGGNITADNSACEKVDVAYIREAVSDIKLNEDCIVVALPEVPVESRLELLRLGKQCGAFTAASCSSAEAAVFMERQGIMSCDLLAINQDEAAAFSAMTEVCSLEDAEQAADKILARYPHLILWLTVGSAGSILASAENRHVYAPLPDIHVENTGGAGDASLAGILAGICRGVPLWREGKADDREWDVGELSVVLAGMSVECRDSIDFNICWESLQERYSQLTGTLVLK